MTPDEARKQLKELVVHARYAEGASLARQVRDAATRENNQELAVEATFVLGQCCFEQLEYQDAWDAFADALAERSEIYGPNHLKTTQSRAWLAGVSMSLDRESEARSLLDRAKSGIPKSPAEDELSIAADALKAIGFVETRFANTNAALEHLRRSLELIEMAKDADELDIAGICVILGMAEQTAKHFVRAEELYQRALEIRLRLLGEDNPLVAYCRKHVGITKMLQGNARETRELVNQSVAGIDSLLSDEPAARASRGTREPIAAREEDHTRALDTLGKALLINGAQDADSPEVAQTLVMMGLMQMGFDKPDLAEPHLRRAVKILLPLHQTELETLFKAFNNMLMALNAQRKYREVLTFVEPIAEKLQKEALVDPAFHAAVIAGLSTGYYGLKKYSKAEKLLRRALGVAESRLGKDARELEPILQNLSQLLEEMGRKAEARTYAQRCAAIQSKYA